MDYSKLYARATLMLAKGGSTAQVTVRTEGAYDVSTAKRAMTETVVVATAVEVSRKYSLDQSSGRRVQKRELWMTCPQLVLPGHTMTWDGSSWTVAESEPITPDGESVVVLKVAVTQ